MIPEEVQETLRGICKKKDKELLENFQARDPQCLETRQLLNKPYVSEAEIGAPIRLARAAALAQMSVAECGD